MTYQNNRQRFFAGLGAGSSPHGAVPARTRIVAPGERSLLLSLSDFMREDARSWSLDVIVKTVRGESYSSELTWK